MDIAFADCVLSLRSRQLTRGGEAVPLEPKMYALLELLVQRRPAVVSNIELEKILWPNVFVSRTSLTRLVSELRTAVGDTSREARIIRTVHKTGYAFAAYVVPIASASQSSSAVSLLWNGRALPLSEGENVAGRGAECSTVVDAATVSRRHALIRLSRGKATIEDLSSTNGTYVNGAPVSAATRLTDGDEVTLGQVAMRFRASDPSALTAIDEERRAKWVALRSHKS